MLLASENMCDVLQTALKDKYKMLPCSDPADGRRFLDQVPDVLILDPFLPGTNGLTFLRENASALPSVIIVLTRFLSDDLLQELETLGVSAMFLIPCRLDCVERQLSGLL